MVSLLSSQQQDGCLPGTEETEVCVKRCQKFCLSPQKEAKITLFLEKQKEALLYSNTVYCTYYPPPLKKPLFLSVVCTTLPRASSLSLLCHTARNGWLFGGGGGGNEKTFRCVIPLSPSPAPRPPCFPPLSLCFSP